jgi:hypothetical protein
LIENLNLLISGSRKFIFFTDISNKASPILISKTNYGGEISEPYDFRFCQSKKVLIIANTYPNILFVNMTNLNETTLISKWDNIYKSTSSISDIELS